MERDTLLRQMWDLLPEAERAHFGEVPCSRRAACCRCTCRRATCHASTVTNPLAAPKDAPTISASSQLQLTQTLEGMTWDDAVDLLDEDGLLDSLSEQHQFFVSLSLSLSLSLPLSLPSSLPPSLPLSL